MILIVDDHQQTREALVRLLKREGIEASAVESGTEALRYLKTARPRLVILDYSMPDMDGLTVFKKMKKDPDLGVVPVVMFSAFDGELRHEALNLGGRAFIVRGAG